jgi:hypothetical protein
MSRKNKHKNTFLICSDDERPHWKKGDEFINGFECINDLLSAISLAIMASKSTGASFIVQFKNAAYITKNNETTTLEVRPADNSVRTVLLRSKQI